MTQAPDPILQAVEALRAAGHTVAPRPDDPALWAVDGDTKTGEEVVALAFNLGLLDGPAGMQ